jgi:VanZ family protein
MRIVAANHREAEQIIIDVWLVLEKMKLPSPMVTISSQSPGLLIDLRFEQPAHEELVRNEALSIYRRAIVASDSRRLGLRWQNIRGPAGRICLIAVALLIVLISLYPFRFTFTAGYWTRLLTGHVAPSQHEWPFEIPLYFPLGIVGFVAFNALFGHVRASIVTLLIGTSLSVIIEALQAFELDKVSSAGDVFLALLTTGCGVLAGYLVQTRSRPEGEHDDERVWRYH